MSLQCKPHLSDLENHSSLVTENPTVTFHVTSQVNSCFSILEHRTSNGSMPVDSFPLTTLISFQVLPSVILLQLFISLPLHVLVSSKNLAFLWQRNPS